MNDDAREEKRAELIRCAMAYVFGDYPGTDDLPTKAHALEALEAAAFELEKIERRRGGS